MNRSSNLKLSVSTSLVAKVLALLLQLFTLPVAAESLRAEGLVVYTMLLSINSWLLLTTSGLSPALVVRLSGSNKATHLKRWATNGYFMFMTIGLTISTLALLLNQISDISGVLFSSEQLKDSKSSLDVIVLIFLMQCICIGSDAIILAYQKQYLTNIALLIASLISLLLLYFARAWIDSAAILIAIVMIPSLIARLLTGLSFIVTAKTIDVSLLRVKYQRILLKSAVEFFKAGSLTNFLLHVLPVLIIGKLYTSDFSAQYSALNSLIIIASSAFTIVCTPLLPALRDSLSKNDSIWFKKSLKKLRFYCLNLVIISLILGWTIGSFVLNYIFTNSIEFGYVYVGLAASYFATLMWSNYHYTILSAGNEVKLLSNVFMKKALTSVVVIILLALFKVEIPPFFVFTIAFLCFEYTKLKKIIYKISYV
ncbi:hypothetical protein LG195_04300 [Proteus terrae]|uniref:hypothetical protein n=1 Tax=Proteus terrae TaxID=1574161 RepID=UPI00207C64E8|nr:hypothetical protein [Proteus terrae]MCO4182528.1 hypothetical protein [Proteus terrae]MCO4188272.1 hypothetical protein [Proteus terrae]